VLNALLPDLWPYLAGLLALIGAAVGLYAKGKGDAKAKTALQAAEAYAKTRRKIDTADIGEGNEDDDRKWLAGAADRLHADK
jgi:hypothetical protein